VPYEFQRDGNQVPRLLLGAEGLDRID
jgi:hypothetical protein